MSRSRRDAMVWLALGLVVALVLAWTARPSAKARDAARPATVSSTSPHTSAPTRNGVSRVATRAGERHPATTVMRANPVTTIPPRHPTASTAPSTTMPATTTTLPRRPPATTESTPPITYRGVLRFPNDVATTYFPNGDGGLLVADGSWAAGQTLELTLTCGGTSDAAEGSGGAVAQLAAASGACHLLVSEPPGATWDASYTLTVHVDPAATRTLGAHRS